MKYLFLFLFSFPILAQNNTNRDSVDKQLEEFRQARKRIMQKMFEDFAQPDEEEFFNDQDFTDTFKMLDQIYKRAGIRPPGGKGNPANRFFKKYGVGSSDVSYKWEEGQREKILRISLKDKNTPIDLDVNEESISIKGKVIQKTKHGSQMSTFSNSFSVPFEVDATKVKIESKDNDILVRLPYKVDHKTPDSGNKNRDESTQQKTKSLKKRSIKPIPGEVNI